jgi:hypothetical protein
MADGTRLGLILVMPVLYSLFQRCQRVFSLCANPDRSIVASQITPLSVDGMAGKNMLINMLIDTIVHRPKRGIKGLPIPYTVLQNFNSSVYLPIAIPFILRDFLLCGSREGESMC